MAIDLPLAKVHLRLESDYPDAQIAPYLSAAEMAAAQFLGRRVYATSAELASAIAAVPDTLVAAGAAHAAAITAANAIADPVARCAAAGYACAQYQQAQTLAAETYAGFALDDLEKADLYTAGVLLILGHLFENRQDVLTGVSVAEMPMGSRYVLQPLRVGMGV